MADGYSPLFQSAGSQYNVDPLLAQAVSQVESSGNPQAVSQDPQGNPQAYGLMQLTAPNLQRLGIQDPYDPTANISGGVQMLNEALNTAKGNVPLALRIYEGGPNSEAWGPQNAAYPEKVAAAYTRLQAAQAAPQAPDDVDTFLSGGQAPAAAAAPSPAAPPANDAAIDNYLSGQTGGTAATPQNGAPEAQPSTGASAPAAAPPTAVQSLEAGAVRGLHDLTDRPKEGLLTGASAIGLTGLANRAGIPLPTGAQATASDQNALASYNQQYGGNPLAATGRIGTDLAGTVGALAGGGELLGAGADALGAAAGEVAPWAGSAVRDASNFLGGTMPGNLALRAGSLAANGALQGGVAGALTAGSSNNPLSSQVRQGAEFGLAAGPVLGAGSAGLGAIGDTITGVGGRASPELAQLAQLARQRFGIPVTGPQLSTNPLTRTAVEQAGRLPFSGASASEAAQQDAWNQAVSRTFGENSPRITPQVMNQAVNRIGSVFQSVAQRNNINVDDQLMNTFGQIEHEAASAPLGDGGHKAIAAQIDNILDAADDTGTISGNDYQTITRANAPLSRAESAADPNVRYYAGQVRDALDDAFQRSAAPQDQAALAQARQQWRAMKTVQPLVAKSPDGTLSPGLLMGAVNTASNRFDPSTGGMAYTGGGDLGNLARIGQAFLKPQPNSGTADRLAINSLLGAGAGAGAVLNPHTLVIAPAALAANRLAGTYLRSGGYANRVINSSLNPGANPLSANLLRYAPPVAILGRNLLAAPSTQAN